MNRSIRIILVVCIYGLMMTSVFASTSGKQLAKDLSTRLTVPDDVPTIQEAVNLAKPGDEIYIRSGRYVEKITITTPSLTLTGEGKGNTTIDVGPLNLALPITEAIWILANNVKITEFTICCSSPMPPAWPTPNGIVIESSQDSTILNNEIKEFANTGLTVIRSNKTKIIGNYINYCGIALHLESSNDNEIRGNFALGSNGVGVQTYTSKNNSVYNNNFDKNSPQQAIATSGDTTAWDSGYLIGGNYWNDYTGIDTFSGPYQNETGNDGIGDTPYIIDASNRDNYPLMNPWLSPDIAVVNVTPSKSIVGQGLTLQINVTIANLGNKIEGFEVTFYANTTSISSQSATVTSGDYRTIFFIWNTTKLTKGNYTLAAYAWPALGETEKTNNILTADTEICLTIAGDVDGDKDVDIFDIVRMAGGFGSRKGDLNYNPNSDLDSDGDIDIFDITVACNHYGENW